MRLWIPLLLLVACDKTADDAPTDDTDTDTDTDLVDTDTDGDTDDTGDTGPLPNVLEPGLFDPPFETTRTTLDVATTTGPRSTVTLVPEGTRTVGGQTLPVVKLLDELGASAGLELVASFEGPRFTLGSVVLEDALAGLDLTIVATTPIVMDLTTPVDEEQSLSIEGEVTIGTPGIDDPGYLPFDFDYTVEALDAVAPAPMGDIPGCRRTTFDTTAGPLAVSGTLWTRDDIGYVHAELESMAWGDLDGGASGYVGFQDDGDEAAIQSERRITPADPTFLLSTAEVNDAADADADADAQLFVEVRWGDAARARTEEVPPVTLFVGTDGTTVDATLTEADVGFLHPELSDEGFHYWVASVDQDATDDTDPGVAWRVEVTHGGGVEGDDVLVGAFIRYDKVAD